MIKAVTSFPIRLVVLLFGLAFFAFVADGISGEAEIASEDSGSLMLLQSDVIDDAGPYLLNTSLAPDGIDQLKADQDYTSKDDIFAPLQGGLWAAIAVSGKVLQHSGNGEHASAVVPGTYLPEHTRIETAPGAWILLSRQNNLVTVKANSTVELLPLEESGRFESFCRIGFGGIEQSTGMSWRSRRCLTITALVRSRRSEKLCRSSTCGDLKRFPITLFSQFRFCKNASCSNFCIDRLPCLQANRLLMHTQKEPV